MRAKVRRLVSANLKSAVSLAFSVILGTTLVACSSPAPTLYTLLPVVGPSQAGGPRVITLQQVGLARYLERLQIVRSSENYRLNVLSNDWWGEPLAGMLGRVLVEELGQRLPNSMVLAESGAVSSAPDATIELNMQRLDNNAAGDLVLQAQAGIVFRRGSAPVLRGFRFVVPAPTPDVAGQVAAASVALGQLADGLALMLLAAPALSR